MKNLFLSFTFLLLAIQLFAQDWAKSGSSSNGSEGMGIAADDHGNVYTVGYFTGSVTFGDVTLQASVVNDVDIFVSKHTSEGALKWVKHYGSAAEDKALAISISKEGNIYITGYFSSGITLNSSALTSQGGKDIFYARIDTSGNFVWAFSAGGAGEDIGKDIEADISGNIYLTGSFQNTIGFGPTSLVSTGNDDIFLARVNSSGAPLWARKAGSTLKDYANALSTDLGGDCYITGGFSSACSFGNTTINSKGETDFYVARYNSSGNLVWVLGEGTINMDEGRGIDVDSEGRSHVVGNSTNINQSYTRYYYNNNYYFTATIKDGRVINDYLRFWKANEHSNINCSTCKGYPSGNDILVDEAGTEYITGLDRIISLPDDVYNENAKGYDLLMLKSITPGNYFQVNEVFNPYSSGLAPMVTGNALTISPSGKIFTTGFYINTASLNNTVLSGSEYKSMVVFGNSTAPAPPTTNFIGGTIYAENNSNCTKDVSESGIYPLAVKMMPGPVYSCTSLDGFYRFEAKTGTYTITPVIPEHLKSVYSRNCPATDHSASFSSFGEVLDNKDYGFNIANCSVLKIHIGTDRRRRCFRGITKVTYCNDGVAPASDVEVKVVYPQYTSPIQSVPVWNSKNDSLLTFNIGTIAPGECNTIAIIDSVSCIEGVTGFAQCTKAYITPKSNCVPDDVSWDKSSVSVLGKCVNGTVRFEIKNKGASMEGSSPYRVFFNNLLGYTGTFMLAEGETIEVPVDAQGQTIRLEADQRPLHPGFSRPRATVEACGAGTLSLADRGFYLQVPEDKSSVEEDVLCMTIIDSFDPNDKNAVPAGITAQNYISSSDYLDYIIRFQNTGTDTAYTVKIVDALDPSLDIEKLLMGSSSHPYTWNVSGTGTPILNIVFNSIHLPDKNTNEPASNGFVRFRIGQKAGNVKGTKIRNKADIYFDYNAPVITNMITHTVNDTIPADPSLSSRVNVITSNVKASGEIFKTSVFPNPAANNSVVTVNLPTGINESWQFSLSTLQGEVVSTEMIQGNKSEHQIRLPETEPGLYIVQLRNDKGMVSYSKLMILSR